MKGSLAWVALPILALGVNACVGEHDGDRSARGQQAADPFHAVIDAGQTLATDLGKGAGVFVEYQPGGSWKVWTSCDTKVTGQICRYRVNILPNGAISNVDGIDLKATDYWQREGDGSYTLAVDVGLDSPGLRFTMPPGSTADMELELDGQVDPSYFVWVSGGSVHDGAPRSPVVFHPDSP